MLARKKTNVEAIRFACLQNRRDLSKVSHRQQKELTKFLSATKPSMETHRALHKRLISYQETQEVSLLSIEFILISQSFFRWKIRRFC